jgi:WD40 repeat protein
MTQPDRSKQQAGEDESAAPPAPTVADAEVKPPPPTPTLTRLGRFQIRRELGRGAFGVVLLAFDPKLGREVALKIPHPEALAVPEIRARFKREARAAASLDHPNLVPVFEAGEVDHVCYLASAFCPGSTLGAWLRERTAPVPFTLAARLVATLAEATEHAHRRGILHRDLKPGNVLLSPRSESVATLPALVADLDFIPRITDFGLAKLLEDDPGSTLAEQQTQTGAVLGTPNYMAPEQAGGQLKAIGPATDVHALGAILYELLTGRPPFRGETPVDTLVQVRTEDPVPPGRLRQGLPRDLETICLKCLQKDPAGRYVSAQALADDLHRWLTRQPILARRTGAVARLALWCRRKPALAATIATAVAAVLSVAAIGAYGVLQERERFRQERDVAQANLYRALAGEARAMIQARDTDWWWKAMDNIRQAAALQVPDRDPTALRELAIECIGTGYPCMRLRENCGGHLGAVEHVTLSQDGRWMASGGADGTARLWILKQVADHQVRAELAAVFEDHAGGVTGLVFHPCGKWLATSAKDGTIRIWQVATLPAATDQPARRFELESPVTALEFSDDGAWLAAGCKDGSVRMLALDPDTAAEKGQRRTVAFQAGAVTCMHFSPEGRLAVGTAGKSIHIWDTVVAKEAEYWATMNAPNAITYSRSLPQSMLIWSEPEGYGFSVYNIDYNARKHNAQIHTGSVRRLAIDWQSRLLSASADGSVKVWNVNHHGTVHEVAVARGSWGEVRAVAASPSADWIATGHQDGRIRLWELTMPLERKFPGSEMQRAVFLGDQRLLATDGRLYDFTRCCDCPPSELFRENVSCITAHPGGRYFAYGSESGALTLADLEREKSPILCPGHRRTVTAVVSNPGGNRLASASLDGTVKVWDWESGACLQTLEPGIGALHALAWDTDQQLVASGEWGIAVCDLDSTACRLFREHAFRQSAMALCRGLLACCGPDHTVLLIDLATGKTVQTLEGHTADITSIAFSPDGRLVAANAAAGEVRLWETHEGKAWAQFQHNDGLATKLSFGPRGRFLAVGGRATFVWEVSKKSALAAVTNTSTCCFRADGNALLLGLTGGVRQCSLEEMEQARTAARGESKTSSTSFAIVHAKTMIVPGGHEATWALAASPDGRWLATGGFDRTVLLWDMQTRKVVRTWEGMKGMVWCLAFSPDGKQLAAGTNEPGSGVIKVWDVQTGRELHDFHGHSALVMGLAFHPSGQWLVTSSKDGSVLQWDLQTGQALGQVHRFNSLVYSLAFRPDGRCLVATTLDNCVGVWDCDGPLKSPTSPSRLLEGHSAGFYSAGFSPDGRYLAAGSEQGVIILWDARTFSRIVALKAGTGQIRHIDFSRDGGLLAGAAYVSSTVVWDLNRLRRTLKEMNLDW